MVSFLHCINKFEVFWLQLKKVPRKGMYEKDQAIKI